MAHLFRCTSQGYSSICIAWKSTRCSRGRACAVCSATSACFLQGACDARSIIFAHADDVRQACAQGACGAH